MQDGVFMAASRVGNWADKYFSATTPMTGSALNQPNKSQDSHWYDMFNPANIGALGGSAAGIFSKLFGGGDKHDPYKEAKPFLEEGYNPYIAEGHAIDPRLHDEYMRLLENPSGFLDKIGSGYKQSPGYQFNLNQQLNAAQNAAAAGGMAGSAANQYASQEVAHGLADQDYYNYIKEALGLHGKGLGGLEGISKRGFEASTGKADRASALAYANATNKNKEDSDFWSGLFKTGAAALPYIIGAL
jgi:hypothetical protein